ncbi:MAG: hypothetical protein KDA67_05400 [Rhodobacteraceae bacterium]|nr:hypothetical protein [Paracoccaceae bacterium]
MKQAVFAVVCAAAFGMINGMPVSAAGTPRNPDTCSMDLVKPIPARAVKAKLGSRFVKDILRVSGSARDAAITDQVLAGNIPDFLRHLIPVTFNAMQKNGKAVEVTICVTPDYMSVGAERDFVRVPMGLPAAAKIADKLGFLLPTTKMVDAIYAQAEVHLAPEPMTPGAQMQSTDYFIRHNKTINQQRDKSGLALTALTAGQKKDLVLSNRLRSKPGRVAIYGWHRMNGEAIQPLSTVHGEGYADYSHGVRLVSMTAFVNGKPTSLPKILQDPELAPIVSSEGPINHSRRLVASLR